MYQLYLEIPIPLRISYFLWAVFIALYLYASLHDSYHSKVKKGRIVQRNFNTIFLLLSVSFVILHQLSIWYDFNIADFIYHSPIFQFMNDKEIKVPSKIWNNNTIYWIGGIIMLVGLIIAAYARAALNGYWTPFIMDYDGDNKKIIDYGIYGIMRHPIYVSQFLLAVGTAFLSNSWFVVFFPLSLAYINHKRALKEEKYLSRAFAKGNSRDTNYKLYAKEVSACGLGLL